MAYTRPSGPPFITDDDAVVTEEIAQIDERGRLNILNRWKERLGWLSTKHEVQALMIFVEPGLISIREWEPAGPSIQNRYLEVTESEEDEKLEILRLIQNRYRRLNISPNERISLGDAALVHLGFELTSGKKGIIYVSVFPKTIQIMSIQCRNEKLKLWNERLYDLP